MIATRSRCLPNPVMPSTFVCRLAAQFPVPLLGGVRGGLVGARFMGRDGVRGPLAGSGAQCAHKVRRVWLKRESNEILPLPRGEGRGEGKENAALPTFDVRCSMFAASERERFREHSEAVCQCRRAAGRETHAWDSVLRLGPRSGLKSALRFGCGLALPR